MKLRRKNSLRLLLLYRTKNLEITLSIFLMRFFFCLLLSFFPIFAVTESSHPYFKEVPGNSKSLYDTKVAMSSSYFIARTIETNASILFKLYPIYEVSNTGPYQNLEEVIFLDNAFHLEYSVITQKTEKVQHSFVYDSLLRMRKIVRWDRGKEVLIIAFSEDGGLVSIHETIPGELSLDILFNPRGQMAVKTIKANNQEWQTHYRYLNGRLARVTSFYNRALLNDRTMTWKSGPEGREINRIDEFNIRGKKTRSWEIEKDLSLTKGEGEENVRYLTPQGKLIKEHLRLWIGGQIIEEHVFQDQLYHKNLYRYDNYGLLKEKITLDKAGKVIVRNYYYYRFPDKITNLVFLEQLKLNTLEITQYLLGNHLFQEQKQFFHLQNLVSQSYERIFPEKQSVISQSYVGGLNTVVSESPRHMEKVIVEPQTGITLSDQKFIYDDFGRIQEIIFSYPTIAYNTDSSEIYSSRISHKKFFYNESYTNLSWTIGSDFYPLMKKYDMGQVYFNYIKRRHDQLRNMPLLSLKEQFKKFFSYKEEKSFSENEEYFLANLKMLRSSGLRKIVAYDHQGQVKHYYRIEQNSSNSKIQETRFSFYSRPPILNLKNSRFKTLLSHSNSYILPRYTYPTLAVNQSNDSYLGAGGWEEFHNQASDNINSLLEKPMETIVIRFQENYILLDAKKILYNPITHMPEKEIIIRGKETEVNIFEPDSY